VPTLTFDLLFALLVLGHGRRKLLWFEVTRHPTTEWLARQITEAFPWALAPAYLLRDNDRVYGHVFRSRVRAMGIRDRPILPGSPWQNGFAERLIGTLRRECLDQMLILGEAQLRCSATIGIAPAFCLSRDIAASSFHVCGVLQSRPYASHATERCAVTSSNPTIRHHCRHSDLGWAALSIRPDMSSERTAVR
jgi:transposase InsO family protein